MVPTWGNIHERDRTGALAAVIRYSIQYAVMVMVMVMVTAAVDYFPGPLPSPVL